MKPFIREYLGGETLEVRESAYGNPPGTEPTDRHVSRPTVWARVGPDGEWWLCRRGTTVASAQAIVQARSDRNAGRAMEGIVSDVAGWVFCNRYD